ncbi:hypothetical protein M885DRAFT_617769 [Pelagophyceae sp. CCMP2097]|nr:hypothetical protein M885DRAFT_617769 [Pelagophyceae sp. CCMP2097]
MGPVAKKARVDAALVRVVDLDDGCGRRVVVDADAIAAGSAVVEDTCPMFALAPGERGRRCAECGCVAEGRACDACETVICQACRGVSGVLERHDAECALLADLCGASESIILIAKLAKCAPAWIADLVAHAAVDAATAANHALIAANLSQLVGGAATPESVLRVVRAVASNTYGMVDHGGLEGEPTWDAFVDGAGALFGAVVGIALSPKLAMINHACAPSATLTFRFEAGAAPRGVARAATNLKKGDSITVSYIPFAATPTASRREALQAAFNFTCGCDACARGAAVDALLAATLGNDAAAADGDAARACLGAVYEALPGEWRRADAALLRAKGPTAAFAPTHELRLQLDLAELHVAVAQRCEARIVDVATRLFAAVAPDASTDAVAPDDSTNTSTDAALLRQLALDPVVLGRVYAIAASCSADASRWKRLAWAKNATNAFLTHLGGDHALSKAAARLQEAIDVRPDVDRVEVGL